MSRRTGTCWADGSSQTYGGVTGSMAGPLRSIFEGSRRRQGFSTTTMHKSPSATTFQTLIWADGGVVTASTRPTEACSDSRHTTPIPTFVLVRSGPIGWPWVSMARNYVASLSSLFVVGQGCSGYEVMVMDGEDGLLTACRERHSI